MFMIVEEYIILSMRVADFLFIHMRLAIYKMKLFVYETSKN